MKKIAMTIITLICAALICFGQSADALKSGTVATKKSDETTPQGTTESGKHGIVPETGKNEDMNTVKKKENIEEKKDEKKEVKKEEKNEEIKEVKKDQKQEIITPGTTKTSDETFKKQNERSANTANTEKKDAVVTTINQDANPEIVIYLPEDPIKKSAHGKEETHAARSLVSPWMSYGLFMPLGAYSSRYYNSPVLAIGMGLPRVSRFGFSPEAYARFMSLSSKPDPAYTDNNLRCGQVSLGAVYTKNLDFSLLAKPLSLSFTLAEGVTRVGLQSAGTKETVEYINTIAMGARLSYPLVWQVDLGLVAGYRVLFTAGSPLQGYSVELICGVRL